MQCHEPSELLFYDFNTLLLLVANKLEVKKLDDFILLVEILVGDVHSTNVSSYKC